MRIIARLDIKNNFVIKGVTEGLRKIGNPLEIAQKYYNDELMKLFLLMQLQVYIEEIISIK